MVYCAAVSCTNDSIVVKGIGYFHIRSRKPEYQKLWLINLKRKNLVLNEHHVVCGEHFEASCFERDLRSELLNEKRPKKLKEDAVPTIFAYKKAIKRRVHTETRLEKKAKLQVRYYHELCKKFVSLALTSRSRTVCYNNHNTAVTQGS